MATNRTGTSSKPWRPAAEQLYHFFNKHYLAVLILSAFIVTGALFATHFATTSSQRYTTFGLLNADGEIGNFPQNVTHGEELNLILTISNNEGRFMAYKIFGYIGDAGTVVEQGEPVTGLALVYNASKVVQHGGTCSLDVTVVPDAIHVGSNRRVIFDLWALDTTTGNFTFTGHSVHVWLDIVIP